MKTEQKAKAYDEALEQAQKELAACGSINCDAARQIFRLFPQLRESEDERIRKRLVGVVKYFRSRGKDQQICEECLAYLEKQKDLDKMIVVSPEAWDKAINDAYENGKKECEKQKERKPNIELIQQSWYMEGYHDREFGKEPKWVIKTGDGGPKHEKNPRYGQYLEPKPAEWSEEDERMWKSALWHIKNSCGNGGKNSGEFEVYQWFENRLKSLRPQSKVEWSEDDKDYYDTIIRKLEVIGDDSGLSNNQIKFLCEHCPSLRTQPHWKPSKEQINYLGAAVIEAQRRHNESVNGFSRYRVLKELYEQLLKL